MVNNTIVKTYKLDAMDCIVRDYISQSYSPSKLIEIVVDLHLLLTLWVSNREREESNQGVKVLFQHLDAGSVKYVNALSGMVNLMVGLEKAKKQGLDEVGVTQDFMLLNPLTGKSIAAQAVS